MRLFKVVSTIALLAYPFAVYFGISQWGLGTVALILAVLFLLRLLAVEKTQLRELKFIAWISGGAGVALSLLGAIFREQGWLTFYPVIVNVMMLGLFTLSLCQQQTIIERFARLQDPELDSNGVLYTRKVTKIWCVFFTINGLIALATCFMPLPVWTIYNGLISYMLMGVLLAGEWLVRQWLLKIRKKSSF